MPGLRIFRSKNKIIILVLFLFALGCSRVTLDRVALKYPNDTADVEKSVELLDRKVYETNSIDGIDLVIRSIENYKSEEVLEKKKIISAVLPHHTLVANQLVSMWGKIALQSNPDVIVIVGPAHEDQSSNKVATTVGTWNTIYGKVHTHDELVQIISSTGVVRSEPEAFENEHSISVHMPYIAKFFPKVKIIPLIANSNVGSADATNIFELIQTNFSDNVLVISSMDFAHYLSYNQSKSKDIETIGAINKLDKIAIDDFKSDHIDSSFALNLYLQTVNKNECDNHLEWQGHSADQTNNFNELGTSYLVYFCSKQNEGSFVINAVGDIMLGRAVEETFAQPVPGAFENLSTLLSKGDLVFGNLESVISDLEGECSSLYCLKARPQMIDVLKQLGFSHLSVINNHAYDYGISAWEDSIEILKNNQIQTIGNYENGSEFVQQEINGKKVIMFAFDEVGHRIDLNEVVEKIEEVFKISDLIIVSVHWGEEYEQTQSQKQIEIAHALIDAGAKIVIGHHPHVLQGIEKYQDGLILYSLGNFLFDQEGKNQNESVIASIGFEDEIRTLQLYPVRIRGNIPQIAITGESIDTIKRINQLSTGVGFDLSTAPIIHW
ncbi:MAG: AmmeMemoRadiSam system protein B [Patescibacteria group bacterium]